MVTDWVMDASIGVKLLATEPDSESCRSFIDGMPATARLLAPGLLRYEVGNALTKRGPIPNLERLIADALAPVETVDPNDVAGHQAGLSYHDAAYLALAVEQKAGLLTADDKMRKAAKEHGVPVGP